MVWKGDLAAFARWCAAEDDPDRLERALRSVPHFLWEAVRGELNAALERRGRLSPVYGRFREVDDELTEALVGPAV